MKIIIEEKKNRYRINMFLDWLIYMFGYTAVLIAVSLIFKKTVIIDNSIFGLWGFFAAVIIYFLNKTIKPIIVWLTLPLTALTLGLFYPFINVFILKMVEFILVGHFAITSIKMGFLVAILISIMNALMDHLIIDPLVDRRKKYE